VRRVGQARKRDALEPFVVEALRQIGVGVIQVSGPGAPDAFAWCPRKGWIALEIKSRLGDLTPAQVESHRKFPINVVRSVDEAVRLFL
jgi:hypothetical protein